jgi:hypothetical protein
MGEAPIAAPIIFAIALEAFWHDIAARPEILIGRELEAGAEQRHVGRRLKDLPCRGSEHGGGARIVLRELLVGIFAGGKAKSQFERFGNQQHVPADANDNMRPFEIGAGVAIGFVVAVERRPGRAQHGADAHHLGKRHQRIAEILRIRGKNLIAANPVDDRLRNGPVSLVESLQIRIEERDEALRHQHMRAVTPEIEQVARLPGRFLHCLIRRQPLRQLLPVDDAEHRIARAGLGDLREFKPAAKGFREVA